MYPEMIGQLLDKLEGFEFSISDYAPDGGAEVVKRAKRYLGNSMDRADDAQADACLRFVLRMRFQSMTETEAAKVAIARSGQGYTLSFTTNQGEYKGSARISPKSIRIRKKIGDRSYKKTAILMGRTSRKYTESMAKGAPANKDGLLLARILFVQLCYERPCPQREAL